MLKKGSVLPSDVDHVKTLVGAVASRHWIEADVAVIKDWEISSFCRGMVALWFPSRLNWLMGK